MSDSDLTILTTLKILDFSLSIDPLKKLELGAKIGLVWLPEI